MLACIMEGCCQFWKKLWKFFSNQDWSKFWSQRKLSQWELICPQSVLFLLLFKNGMEKGLECWKELSMFRCLEEQEEEARIHQVLLSQCWNHSLMLLNIKNYSLHNQRMILWFHSLKYLTICWLILWLWKEWILRIWLKNLLNSSNMITRYLITSNYY